MSLSAEQINEYQTKWWNLIDIVLSDLLLSSGDIFSNKQICSTFWTAMCGFGLGAVLDELEDGYDIFIQDEWSVELPRLLIEENSYTGDVVIDLAGARTSVRLEIFCLVAKLAAIFYKNYVDGQFEPWAYFLKIDQMCEKFRVVEKSPI